jgi:transcription elongation GreA/GreB family factor
MSRAFVKEDSDAPEPPRPERPISAAPNRVTPRGARLIAREVEALRARLDVASEDEIESLRRDLRYWNARLASMRVVPAPLAPDVVGFGTRVTIRRGAATGIVSIVGEDEADPPNDLIAWTAPLARALDGAEVSDLVEFRQSSQRETVEVVAIEPYDPRD